MIQIKLPQLKSFNHIHTRTNLSYTAVIITFNNLSHCKAICVSSISYDIITFVIYHCTISLISSTGTEILFCTHLLWSYMQTKASFAHFWIHFSKIHSKAQGNRRSLFSVPQKYIQWWHFPLVVSVVLMFTLSLRLTKECEQE